MRARLLAPCFTSLALLLCSSCAKDSKKAKARAQKTRPQQEEAQATKDASTSGPTWYRAVLSSESHRVPFFMRVPARGGEVAVVQRGEEYLEIPIKWTDETHFVVAFELLQSSLSVTVAEDQSLTGNWTLDSGSWGKSTLAVVGAAVEAPKRIELFDDSQGSANPVSGVWRLQLKDSGEGKLALVEKGGAVTGTLRFPSGNVTRLEGEAMGGRLRLAGFDSSSAYLLEARIVDDTLQAGTWTAGAKLDWRETFTGELGEDFEFPSGPVLNKSEGKISIPGVDLSAYAGSPMIVETGGAWCITCRFAAPFLREVYGEFHEQGLEMVTVTYEFTDDEAYNRKRAQEFKTQYKLPWEVVPVHGAAADFLDLMPANLQNEDVSGFPFSLFVRRDGSVMSVLAGFPSPGDKELYAETTADYRAQVARLLAGE